MSKQISLLPRFTDHRSRSSRPRYQPSSYWRNSSQSSRSSVLLNAVAILGSATILVLLTASSAARCSPSAFGPRRPRLPSLSPV